MSVRISRDRSAHRASRLCIIALAGALQAAMAGSAGADGALWLVLSIGNSDPTLAGLATALRQGQRFGLIATLGNGRAYPVPGFVPVEPSDLDRGIGIVGARGESPLVTLGRDAVGNVLLFDGAGAVVSVPRTDGEPPVVGLELPLELLRLALPAPGTGGAGAVARERIRTLAVGTPSAVDAAKTSELRMALERPVRNAAEIDPSMYDRMTGLARTRAGLEAIQSELKRAMAESRVAAEAAMASGAVPRTPVSPRDLGRMDEPRSMRSLLIGRVQRDGTHERDVVPRFVFQPDIGLVPEFEAGPSILPVSLGTGVVRWLFSSSPEGATLTFDGLSVQARTSVGIRNVPAAALRGMVMRMPGYRECHHGEARRDVVFLDGLEWNSIHCLLRPLGQ